ncbi:hypothetical protein Hypma_007134 [Hypsizygus marmoreus]|uniref:Uncharacterized protein n=1 Tax=Hypsizygus marmoreus TaxID=39966 RepID=A0A369KHA7_HYPMA|nr:hypothetical protein Hypma_007134 [Hypsizygus marmoreus]
MTSTKLGDDFLRVPKLDVSGSNWVIYKDRFLWSVDARGLLEHLDGTLSKPVDPIPDRDPESPPALTAAQVQLDADWKKETKTWKQGEATSANLVAGV